MVGILEAPAAAPAARSQLGGAQGAVDKHEAEGKVGRLSPDDFVPLKRPGNGDAGSASTWSSSREPTGCSR